MGKNAIVVFHDLRAFWDAADIALNCAAKIIFDQFGEDDIAMSKRKEINNIGAIKVTRDIFYFEDRILTALAMPWTAAHIMLNGEQDAIAKFAERPTVSGSARICVSS